MNSYPSPSKNVGCLCKIRSKCLGFDRAQDDQGNAKRIQLVPGEIVTYMGLPDNFDFEIAWVKILHSSGMWYVVKSSLEVIP